MGKIGDGRVRRPLPLRLVAEGGKEGRVTRGRRRLAKKIRYVVQERKLMPLLGRALPKNSIAPLVWGALGRVLAGNP